MRQSRSPNDYWSALKRLLVWGSNDYSFRLRTNSSSYIKPLLNRAQTTITATLPPLLLLHTPSDCQSTPSREDRSGSHDYTSVIRKPFALSQGLLLFSGGKSIVLVKEKASSRSGFLLSMYVVLKTRYVNPNIHVCRY